MNQSTSDSDEQQHHASADAAHVVRAALLAFAASRVLVLLALILLGQISFLQKVHSGSVWETRIELQRQRLVPELSRLVMTGDSWWYRSIAGGGYADAAEWPAAGKRAFFPLYPLLVRVSAITGSFAIDGAIVSNVAFLLALVLTGLLALRFGSTADDATRAVFYLAFFPTSYFFSLPLTESLFLFLSVGAVYAASRDRWWLAGIAGALAAMTRVPGIVLAPVLLLFAWQRDRRPSFAMLAGAAVPLGTLAFMFHLHRTTGDALAFVQAQHGWGRHPAAFWQPLFDYASRPGLVGTSWNLVAFNFFVAILLVCCAITFVVRREWALGAYVAGMLFIPLSSGSLQSLSRYALVVFPLFFWLGRAGRSPLVDRLIFATSVAAFGWFLALFALRIDFALV